MADGSTPLADVNMNRFDVEIETRGGGVTVMGCREPLGPMPTNTISLLRDVADANPEDRKSVV